MREPTHVVAGAAFALITHNYAGIGMIHIY
ncbi:Protein of unknown function [Bacillus wiedmannii]|nr:Protein of unknown function [Bacillus wiedmannii]